MNKEQDHVWITVCLDFKEIEVDVKLTFSPGPWGFECLQIVKPDIPTNLHTGTFCFCAKTNIA